MREGSPALLRKSRIARLAAFAAAASLLWAVRLPGATTFGAAYLNSPSGPASGGSAVLIVGNQFQSGTTVTVGGAFVGATVRSSTLMSATMPARPAGGLSDVVVTNPGGATREF